MIHQWNHNTDVMRISHMHSCITYIHAHIHECAMTAMKFMGHTITIHGVINDYYL